MTRAELRWCLGYAVLLAMLTTAPYAAGFMAEDSTWGFTGSVFAVEDGNSYIAKMRLGAEGQWLFRTPYSAQSQAGIPAFLPYILLGKLAGRAPSHQSLVLLYHALRLVAIPVAVVSTYRFLAEWLGSVGWRRWGTIVSTLGGGLGWLLLLGRPPAAPLEFYSPEAFGFLAFFGIPHLILARAALLAGVLWHGQAVRRGTWGWRAGTAWLALAVLQPLALAGAVAAVVAQAIASARSIAGEHWSSWLRSAIGALALPAPYMLYLAIAYAREPSVQAWADQNLLPSPPLWHYLVSYLPLLPLAIYGGRRLRERDPASSLVVWPILLLLLAYAPIGVQRRLIEGIWPALVALAAVALLQLEGSRPQSAWLGRAALGLGLPCTLLLLAAGMRVGLNPSEPAFRPAAELSAFGWLAEHAPSGSVVLGAFETGNALPAWAPVRVVIGHGPETADLERLRPEVQAYFFAETSEAARRKLLHDQAVDYVFWGPYERELGPWNPASSAQLQIEYEADDHAIFSVHQR